MSVIPDMSALSAEDLKAMEDRIKEEKNNRHKQNFKSARDEINAILTRTGFTLQELFPGKVQGQRSAKYRNPADQTQVWVGAGRRPSWLTALIEEGEMEGKSVHTVLQECASET